MSTRDELCPQIALHALGNYAQRLPQHYQIAIRLSDCGYTVGLIDPDGVQVAIPPYRTISRICELAEEDARRRASDGVH